MREPDGHIEATGSTQPWYKILYVQVLIAIGPGIAIGYFYPAFGKELKPLGDGLISTTIAWLAARDDGDEAVRAVTWDLMQRQRMSVGGVIDQFRFAFGTADWPRSAMPAFLLDLGARLGDLANRLGWIPPMRTTALVELRHGVTGDPTAWMDATDIVPKTIDKVAGRSAATIQDKWFARLFLIKALITRDFPQRLAAPFAAITGLMDISIGILTAFRRTCAFGFISGIVVALGYMAGTAVLTTDLWIEPLGALVKTFPAISLMLVALLILDNR
jgi:hypothetical protein